MENELKIVNMAEIYSLTEHCRFYGKNGYGASVVRGPDTYGADQGLWELAVLKWDKDGWRICYNTPITNKVIGYLTEDGVYALLEEIAKLPEESLFVEFRESLICAASLTKPDKE